MKKILLILCLIINTYKCELKKYNHTNNESNLYFVLTTFRHGARYPLGVKKDIFHIKNAFYIQKNIPLILEKIKIKEQEYSIILSFFLGSLGSLIYFFFLALSYP